MEFSLTEGSSASLEERLLSGEIDLAVGVFSERQHKANPLLETTVLLDERVYLAVADRLLERGFPGRYPECREEFLDGISLKDFLHFPVVLYPRKNRIHTEIQEYYRNHGARPNVLV